MKHLFKVWIGPPFNILPEFVRADDNDKSPVLSKMERMASRLGPHEATARLCTESKRMRPKDESSMMRLWQQGSPFKTFWERVEDKATLEGLEIFFSAVNDRLVIERHCHPSKANRVMHTFVGDKEVERGFKELFCGPPEKLDLILTNIRGEEIRLAPTESELAAMVVFRVMNC
jgi:hypothetical protein